LSLGLAIATLNGRGFAGPNVFAIWGTLESGQHQLLRTHFSRTT